ncbi:TetR/AcrR family transcriptional regulator [Eubacteriales bacterium OttesenSCG-928-N13]|nr:TetR/AcrR family transcriptional regulator [Eubacteriales bacterium OttesenSCG-928-N13]
MSSDAKRVPKAKRQLSDAMLALLRERSFQRIGVNDLCEHALISRATFYTHFEDKYDLLRYALTQIRRQLREIAQSGQHDVVDLLVSFVYDNADLFRNLLMRESNPELVRMLSELFITDIARMIEQSSPETPVVPPMVQATFVSGGLSHLMVWWIDSGFSVSREEMAGYLRGLGQAAKKSC